MAEDVKPLRDRFVGIGSGKGDLREAEDLRLGRTAADEVVQIEVVQLVRTDLVLRHLRNRPVRVRRQKFGRDGRVQDVQERTMNDGR